MKDHPSSKEEVQAFCRRLDEAASDKGWLRIHVAERTHTSPVDLAMLYLESRPPGVGFLMAAAAALEVSEEWLRTRQGEKRPLA